MNKFNEFEAAAIEQIKEILKMWLKNYPDVGLQVQLIGPKHSYDDSNMIRESELEIRFLDGEDIVDVLEFFLYREGKKVTSLLEVDNWLKGNLEDIARQRLEK